MLSKLLIVHSQSSVLHSGGARLINLIDFLIHIPFAQYIISRASRQETRTNEKSGKYMKKKIGRCWWKSEK